jgi:hypothetical protein
MPGMVAIELHEIKPVISALGEYVKGESYYIEAPHNLPFCNDALRGIITGRPNRTNRG